MTLGDYVDALKWYSQSIALSPKDAALYSNRSFTFLKLGLPARALADAEDAIRLKPGWAKGHFRHAAALTLAGLHERALKSYSNGLQCDPSDEHLHAQCKEAVNRAAAARQHEKMVVVTAAMVVTIAIGLLSPSNGVGFAYLALALMCGAVFGTLGGAAFVLLRRHQREGAVLAPLQSNDEFAAMQMKGDTSGAGELRTATDEDGLHSKIARGDKGTANDRVRQRSTANGRAAAMKAKREGRIRT